MFVALMMGAGAVIYNETKDVPAVPAQVVQTPEPDPRSLIGADAPDVVHAVIEIQEGTQSRYAYNVEEDMLELAEAPYHELNMPGDFGTIPQTLTRGGGLLGVVVLTTDPAPYGTMLDVRPIAVVVADEGAGMVNTILAVPIQDIRYRDVDEIADLQQADKDAIIEYVRNYKNLQGRPAVSTSVENSKTAKGIIELARKAFLKSNRVIE